VDGGSSFIEACKRLDWQSDTLTREATQSSDISSVESSSKSVISTASLKSQVCPVPVSPVEPHITLNGHPICADGNTVHNNSVNTRKEANERIVTTTPYKYEDDEVVNKFVEMFQRFPWRLWPAKTLDAIVPCSQPRLQEQLFTRIIHDGWSRKRANRPGHGREASG
jgi:hypothetical protein